MQLLHFSCDSVVSNVRLVCALEENNNPVTVNWGEDNEDINITWKTAYWTRCKISTLNQRSVLRFNFLRLLV